jgi:hypothetical protein
MEPRDVTERRLRALDIHNAFALGIRAAEEIHGKTPHSTLRDPKCYEWIKGVADGTISAEPSGAELRRLHPGDAADSEAAAADSRKIFRGAAQIVLRVLDWSKAE